MTREKHLELLQGVINRMAGNSFQLKGWSVVLVSALFALAANDMRVHFVFVAYFPALAFWVLDGYFLRQERMYRKLYDEVREAKGDPDFSLDASGYAEKVDSWATVCLSKTLLIFHGMVLGVVIAATILMFAVAS
ncbi:MAG: hypothetical protein ABFD90_07300 [Phycisphaerales bacterium]